MIDRVKPHPFDKLKPKLWPSLKVVVASVLLGLPVVTHAQDQVSAAPAHQEPLPTVTVEHVTAPEVAPKHAESYLELQQLIEQATRGEYQALINLIENGPPPELGLPPGLELSISFPDDTYSVGGISFIPSIDLEWAQTGFLMRDSRQPLSLDDTTEPAEITEVTTTEELLQLLKETDPDSLDFSFHVTTLTSIEASRLASFAELGETLIEQVDEDDIKRLRGIVQPFSSEEVSPETMAEIQKLGPEWVIELGQDSVPLSYRAEITEDYITVDLSINTGAMTVAHIPGLYHPDEIEASQVMYLDERPGLVVSFERIEREEGQWNVAAELFLSEPAIDHGMPTGTVVEYVSLDITPLVTRELVMLTHRVGQELQLPEHYAW